MDKAGKPRFRVATPADADFLVRLIDISSHGGIADHYRQIYGPETDWRRQARADILANGPELGYRNAVIISIGQQDAAGMFLNALRLIPAPFAFPEQDRAGKIERLMRKITGYLFIRELAVMPSFRGRGLGRRLVEFSMAHASQIKSRGVGLTVNADNAPAVALYETSGFTELTRIAIEGRDVMLMAIDATKFIA
jgi:ribosomal protein S18 acetylase RimI-like enzyme